MDVRCNYRDVQRDKFASANSRFIEGQEETRRRAYFRIVQYYFLDIIGFIVLTLATLVTLFMLLKKICDVFKLSFSARSNLRDKESQ